MDAAAAVDDAAAAVDAPAAVDAAAEASEVSGLDVAVALAVANFQQSKVEVLHKLEKKHRNNQVPHQARPIAADYPAPARSYYSANFEAL